MLEFADLYALVIVAICAWIVYDCAKKLLAAGSAKRKMAARAPALFVAALTGGVYALVLFKLIPTPMPAEYARPLFVLVTGALLMMCIADE